MTVAESVHREAAIAGTIGGNVTRCDGRRVGRVGVGMVVVGVVGIRHVIVLKDASAVVAIVLAVFLRGGHGASHEFVTIEWFWLGVAIVALVNFGAASGALAARSSHSIGGLAARLRVESGGRSSHGATRLRGGSCVDGFGLGIPAKGVVCNGGWLRGLRRGDAGLGRALVGLL